jgi:hypothetical protein
MDAERFIERLDEYLALADKPLKDPERLASRALLHAEMNRLSSSDGLEASLAVADERHFEGLLVFALNSGCA